MELSDQNYIDLKKSYLFGISLFNPGDSVTIEEVLEVASFNDKMWESLKNNLFWFKMQDYFLLKFEIKNLKFNY